MIKRETFQSVLLKNLEHYSAATAIEYGGQQVSYRELEHRSHNISQWIVEQGIGKGTIIGIWMDDRIDIISTLIGVLRAGCVFMILETGLPLNRIQRMIKLTDTRVFICDAQQEEKLNSLEINSNTNQSLKVLILNQEFYNNKKVGETQPPVIYHPEDSIYIYFTSGTTGDPKAIIGKNKSLLHFIRWEIHTFGIDTTFRVSQFTNPGFDAFLRDIFVPLFSGAVICIPPHNDMPVNDGLIQWLDNNDIRLIHCVPSIFRLFNTSGIKEGNFKNLKAILLSGEAITPGELKNWYETVGDRVQLVNLYGATETTMIKTVYPITPSDVQRESIPIGKPMRGAQLVICDKRMTPCEPGIVGDIYIRTPFATHGYCNDPENTVNRFIPNPFNPVPGDFLYRTGDMGRELPDGNIELKGRRDRQVKLRGIRVQLEEIEHSLLEHQKVQQTVVVEKQADRENYLCAYVVIKQAQASKTQSFSELPVPKDAPSQHNRPETQPDRLPLTPDEQTRYKRQMMLEGWGTESQEKLKQTVVFVAGAGGSGSPLIMQLALAGIGTIIVSDFDDVEPSNLNRQCLHDLTRLNMNKAISAQMTIERINPFVKVIARPERITAENVYELVGDAAVIFDNVDDLPTKFILSACAVEKKIPHVISSMMDINAYAAVFYPPHSPCFHCLYDRELVAQMSRLRAEANSTETTSLACVSSSLFLSTGFVVTEALKILLGLGKPAYNKFFLFNQKGSEQITQTDGYRLVTLPYTAHFKQSAKADGFDWDSGWSGKFIEEISVPPNPNCPVCHHVQGASAPDNTESIASKENETVQSLRNNENIALLITELRDYLTGKLPYYMVPTYFITVDHIPLSPNGKVDQRMLPDPQANALSAYVPPGNPIEEKLVEIWSDVLEKDKELIGTETGFFELGGHSLKATIMMSMVNKEFKITLPLAEVFRRPTIKHLAHCLTEIQQETGVTQVNDDNLVLLRKGTEPNKHLFLIHAGNGEVEGYIQFANLLKPEFTYWGIRADRVQHYAPRYCRQEDIAAKYIEKIKKVQPKGPYYIVGWCLGGPITFEMVYQLEQQKNEIGFFALIDSGAPLESFYPWDKSDFSISSELRMLGDFFRDEAKLKPLQGIKQLEQFWPLVVEYLEKLKVDIQLLKQGISSHVPGVRRGVEMEVIPNSQHIGLKDLIYYFNQVRSMRNARARYTPKGKVRTPVHYFEATESKGKSEFAEPWHDLFENPMKWYEVQGGHFSIFEQPRVTAFAKQFDIF